MIQLTPHMRIFVAKHPVDFRKGVVVLAAICKQVLGEDPLWRKRIRFSDFEAPGKPQ